MSGLSGIQRPGRPENMYWPISLRTCIPFHRRIDVEDIDHLLLHLLPGSHLHTARRVDHKNDVLAVHRHPANELILNLDCAQPNAPFLRSTPVLPILTVPVSKTTGIARFLSIVFQHWPNWPRKPGNPVHATPTICSLRDLNSSLSTTVSPRMSNRRFHCICFTEPCNCRSACFQCGRGRRRGQ